MIESSWLAALSAMLVFGALGSLHCAGMCSPLVCATCGLSGKRVSLLLMVRLLSYSLAGVIIGGFGHMIVRTTSRVPGLILLGVFGAVALCFLILPDKSTLAKGNHFLSKPASFFSHGLRHLQRSKHGSLALGALMPLLPCGFLWMALAQAAILGDAKGSGLAMAAFAIGTSPALVLGNGFWSAVKQKLTHLHPAGLKICGFMLAALMWGWTFHAISIGELPCH